MVLTFWELDHEEILTVVRACGYRECSLIMISPLLLEDRKEEFMTVVESNVRAAQKQIRLTLRTILFPQLKTSGSDAKNTGHYDKSALRP